MVDFPLPEGCAPDLSGRCGSHKRMIEYCTIERIKEALAEVADLAMEAADALWALDKGKKPDRSPRAINQDIYDVNRRLGYPGRRKARKGA